MKIILLIIYIIISSENVVAQKSLSAHVHGLVGLDLAVDKNEFLIMLKSPSSSFLSFEYKARSKKEVKQLGIVKKEWEENIIKFLGEDALKDCKIKSYEWKQEFSGENHSEILAESYIMCKKKLAGRELSINLKEKYPNISVIHLQLLRNDGTAVSKRFKKNIIKIKL
jgi:hypothetical protein